MKTLVVSAADSGFFSLLQGLIRSLHQWRDLPFTDIAVFDLGLSPEQRAWVSRSARHIVVPGWDFPVPDSVVRAGVPYQRAVTVRPFLPRYFPGYDLYLWLDADIWVQERFALDGFIAAARDGKLAVVPETHPTYKIEGGPTQWRTERMIPCYGEEAFAKSRWSEFVNAGVFALRADTPHWALWAKWFLAGLERSGYRWFCDQTALNHTLWTENLPVRFLPAVCNWMCHMALPRYDYARHRFCTPDDAAEAIGILHLAAETKSFPDLRYSGPHLESEPAPSRAESAVYKGISF